MTTITSAAKPTRNDLLVQVQAKINNEPRIEEACTKVFAEIQKQGHAVPSFLITPLRDRPLELQHEAEKPKNRFILEIGAGGIAVLMTQVLFGPMGLLIGLPAATISAGAVNQERENALAKVRSCNTKIAMAFCEAILFSKQEENPVQRALEEKIHSLDPAASDCATHRLALTQLQEITAYYGKEDLTLPLEIEAMLR